MRTSDFDYPLPRDLIAQTPLEPRDQSRLLVMDRAHDTLAHRFFHELPSLLRSGAVHMAAVQQNVSYQKELHAGDTVAVRTGVLELREKVLRFRHELFNTETGDVCSTCEFTVVCLDPQARRSRAFPPEVAARATELLITAEC